MPKDSAKPEIVEQKIEPTPVFNFVLLVKNPFNHFTKGRFILDAQEIDAVIKSGNAANCLKIQRQHLSPNS